MESRVFSTIIVNVKSDIKRYSISPVGLRIMRLLIGHPPRTMTELIDGIGVTRTAITEQLNGLITSGYIVQTMERLSGRGRPRYLFSATQLALKQLFEGNQDRVVPAIWRALRKHGSPEIIQKVGEEVADELADYFNRQMTAVGPKERLKEFIEIICKGGSLGMYREEDGDPIFDRLGCPFISMYDGTEILCEIDRMTMTKVVGAEVERIRYRQEGSPCCCFRIKKKTMPKAESNVLSQ